MRNDFSTSPTRPGGRAAALAAVLTLLWIGCGAAAGDGSDPKGGQMRELATITETAAIPEIDRNRPADFETATFAMG